LATPPTTARTTTICALLLLHNCAADVELTVLLDPMCCLYRPHVAARSPTRRTRTRFWTSLRTPRARTSRTSGCCWTRGGTRRIPMAVRRRVAHGRTRCLLWKHRVVRQRAISCVCLFA
jgi:hypothetical protein